MRKVFTVFLLFATVLPGLAQLDNGTFDQHPFSISTDSSRLFLSIKAMGFFRNNEYFQTVVDGYTLFGYQLNPSLTYLLTSSVMFDAGIYLQKDFGNNHYSQVAPTFSLTVKKDDWRVTFGTLNGSLNHRLVEPLYDFERVMHDRIEDGVQFLWQSPNDMFLDAWIDWKRTIYFGDPTQEWLWAGTSFEKVLSTGSSLRVAVPVQWTVEHHGGQINNTNLPVSTAFNGCLGVDVGAPQGWGIRVYGLIYEGSSSMTPFRHGGGLYVNPYIKWGPHLSVMGSYWYARDYVSSEGGRIYPSVNSLYPSRIDSNRSFYMVRIAYNLDLAPGLHATGRAEVFYDTYARQMEYNYGLYFSFADNYHLLNARHP